MSTQNISEFAPQKAASGDLDTPADVPQRRYRSKIAALPKDQREVINKLLLDGSTYATVISRMAEQGISLNAENVSSWYQTGFQDYLAHLERLDNQRAKHEAATDLLQNIDVSKIPEAGLQTAAAQIYDLLGRFTPDAIAATLINEPDKYIRIINSLSRLTREALAIKKYTDSRSRAALRQLDIHRKLDQSENRVIVRKVDEVFGLAHLPDPDAPTEHLPTSSPSPEELPESDSPGDEPSHSTPAINDFAQPPTETTGDPAPMISELAEPPTRYPEVTPAPAPVEPSPPPDQPNLHVLSVY